MNKLFMAILVSVSTLLLSCSGEGSSNSNRGGDNNNSSNVLTDDVISDNVDAGGFGETIGQ